MKPTSEQQTDEYSSLVRGWFFGVEKVGRQGWGLDRGNFYAKKGEGFSRKVSFYDELCGGSYNFLCKFILIEIQNLKKSTLYGQ